MKKALCIVFLFVLLVSLAVCSPNESINKFVNAENFLARVKSEITIEDFVFLRLFDAIEEGPYLWGKEKEFIKMEITDIRIIETFKKDGNENYIIKADFVCFFKGKANEYKIFTTLYMTAKKTEIPGFPELTDFSQFAVANK